MLPAPAAMSRRATSCWRPGGHNQAPRRACAHAAGEGASDSTLSSRASPRCTKGGSCSPSSCPPAGAAAPLVWAVMRHGRRCWWRGEGAEAAAAAAGTGGDGDDSAAALAREAAAALASLPHTATASAIEALADAAGARRRTPCLASAGTRRSRRRSPCWSRARGWASWAPTTTAPRVVRLLHRAVRRADAHPAALSAAAAAKAGDKRRRRRRRRRRAIPGAAWTSPATCCARASRTARGAARGDPQPHPAPVSARRRGRGFSMTSPPSSTADAPLPGRRDVFYRASPRRRSRPSPSSRRIDTCFCFVNVNAVKARDENVSVSLSVSLSRASPSRVSRRGAVARENYFRRREKVCVCRRHDVGVCIVGFLESVSSRLCWSLARRPRLGSPLGPQAVLVPEPVRLHPV